MSYLMTAQNKITKIQQQIAKDERNIALEKIKQRKAGTRKKIELGGLVIKAKMHEYSKAVIFGALIEAEFHLRCDEDLKRLYLIKGEASFHSWGLIPAANSRLQKDVIILDAKILKKRYVNESMSNVNREKYIGATWSNIKM